MIIWLQLTSDSVCMYEVYFYIRGIPCVPRENMTSFEI
jgi:hypothetical protein